ncbi:ribosomal RNA small subunit methyltransferase D [Clostridiales bacterium]|nr:ribosomal RNA small subunit methyltransferase D [Clostridiales bacterium]
MRVIAGSARRLRLEAPEGIDTRPTADRVKESLFNMLNPDIFGCRFLDLFSGSGAIGIEALSRGAKKVVFVDSSERCLNVIKRNLNFTGLSDKAEIIKSDVYAAIQQLRDGEQFDIIFMDPPYAGGFYLPVLKEIYEARILASSGFVVAESSKEYKFSASENFTITKERKCGPAVMTFLNLEEERC